MAWNPSDKSANCALSNGNLTATAGANGARVRSSAATHSTGKRMFAFQATVLNTSNVDAMAGISNASLSMAENAGYPGHGNNHAIAVNTNAGGSNVFANSQGVNQDVITDVSQGAWVLIAYDFDAQRFWVRVGTNNWNPWTSANPASGTGGIDMSSHFSGAARPFFAGWPYGGTQPAFTIDVLGTAYPHTPPAGWTWWEASGVTISAPAAAVSVAASAPVVAAGATVLVPAAAVAVAGQAPTVSAGAATAVPVASAAVAAHAPNLSSGGAVQAPSAAVAVAGNAPSVATGATVQPLSASVTTEAHAPSASVGAGVSVPVAGVSVAAFAPVVATAAIVSPPAAVVSVVPLAPGLGNAIVDVPGTSVGIVLFAPTVLAMPPRPRRPTSRSDRPASLSTAARSAAASTQRRPAALSTARR